MVLTVCDIAPKVLADDDVPCRSMASVKLLLDLSRDVLLDVVLLQSNRRNLDGLLLHLLGHVDVLDGSLGHTIAAADESEYSLSSLPDSQMLTMFLVDTTIPGTFLNIKNSSVCSLTLPQAPPSILRLPASTLSSSSRPSFAEPCSQARTR